MKRFDIGVAAICEFIARGANRKNTLVNVYAGDIVAREFPVRLSLAFYAEIGYVSPTDDEKKMIVEVHVGDEVPLQIEADTTRLPKGKQSIIVIQRVDLVLESETTISLWIKAEGYADKKVISKKVLKKPISAATA